MQALQTFSERGLVLNIDIRKLKDELQRVVELRQINTFDRDYIAEAYYLGMREVLEWLLEMDKND